MAPREAGYLRRSRGVDAETDDIRAICWIHGCSLTRGTAPAHTITNADSSATGRPYGLLWRCLEVADQYLDKKAHRARFIAEAGAWDERKAARERLFLEEDFDADWYNAERDLWGTDTSLEPEGIAGGLPPEAKHVAAPGPG